MTKARAIYQLKMTLVGVTPPIVRRFQVWEDTHLGQLHRYLQVLMNWQGYHLHQFVAQGRTYAVPDPEEPQEHALDEKKGRLSRLLKTVGSQIEYHYDFGDGWEHDIYLEAILIPEPGFSYPRCISAERNSPPEDCGGPIGYMEFVEALSNRMHPMHKQYREWLSPFDAEFCSIDILDGRLKAAAASRRVPQFEPVYVSPFTKKRQHDRTVEIDLTEHERDLIVNHTLADESLIQNLKQSRKAAARKYRFRWEELDDLAGIVQAESESTRNRKLQAEWQKIYGKMTSALDAR